MNHDLHLVRFLLVALLAPLPTFVAAAGTQAQCLALGGSWERDSNTAWISLCWADGPEEKCLSGRGSWFPDQNRCRLPLTDSDLKTQCEAGGGSWGRHGGNFEHCFFEEEKTKCLADGGQWKRMGIMQSGGCLLPSRDGGKSCTNSSQCQFKCLAIARPPTSDTQVVGECARNNDPFGCKAFVEGGLFVQGPCVD